MLYNLVIMKLFVKFSRVSEHNFCLCAHTPELAASPLTTQLIDADDLACKYSALSFCDESLNTHTLLIVF